MCLCTITNYIHMYICSKHLQKPRWGKLLLLVALATTFGGAVSTGYCIGVINAPSKVRY